MRRKKLILQILGTPLTALLGFVVGFLVVTGAGVELHNDYGYFFGEGLRGVIGNIVIFGGATVGALIPWLPRKWRVIGIIVILGCLIGGPLISWLLRKL